VEQARASAGAALLFLKSHRDVGVGRQANLIPLYFGDQAAGDEMMMAFVAALAAVALGQLDAVAFDPVDCAKMDAVGADHFHMLANILEAAHSHSPLSVAPERTTPSKGCKGSEPASPRFVRYASTTGMTEREVMGEPEREPVEKVTIIETGNGGGSGGVLAVVVLIIVVLVLLFLFRHELGLGGKAVEIEVPDKIEVNVN